MEAHEEEQEVFTLQEYIEREEETQDALGMLLGHEEHGKCTYDKGYRPRQAIFACLTCTRDGDAGICTECAMTCHEALGHEVAELWTKRNFRCDCGNQKFGQPCQLQREKDCINSSNSYNQNFKGLYCTCHRPYPDKERQEEEDPEQMFQCVVCEDWFHMEHINLNEAANEVDFEELICPACVTAKCKFLVFYPHLLKLPRDPSANTVTEEPLPGLTASHAAVAAPLLCSPGNDQSGDPDPSGILPGIGGVEAQAGGEERTRGKLSLRGQEGVPGDIQRGTGVPGNEQGKTGVPGNGHAEKPVSEDMQGGKGVLENREGSSATGKSPNADGLKQHTPFEGACQLAVKLCGKSLSEALASVAEADIVAAMGGCGPSAQARGSTVGDTRPQTCVGTGGAAARDTGARVGEDEGGRGGVPGALMRGRWRSELCKCAQCLSCYEAAGVAFLTEEADTIRAYSELGKRRAEELGEKAMQAQLQKLGRVGQAEVLYGMRDFSSALTTFLNNFEGTTVTPAHVQEFVEDFRRKRQRLL